jgi:hypothetical protein
MIKLLNNNQGQSFSTPNINSSIGSHAACTERHTDSHEEAKTTA